MATRGEVWVARWRAVPIALASTLTPDEACRVLRTDLVRWQSREVPLGATVRCVVGSADPDRVDLVALHPWDTNSLRPTFRGRVDARGDGCVLVGELGPPRVVKVIGVVWLAVLAVALLLGAAVTVLQLAGGENPQAVFVVGVAVVMLAGTFALSDFGGRAGDGDAAYLRTWLETRLAAAPDPATEP